MSIDSNGVVTNEALARYDAGIKDIIAMRTAEKNPVRYKVVKSTSTGSQTYSFYKKDENDTDFVVDSASDAITVQDSIDSTSKDPVNGVAVAAKFAEQMTTQNINSIIGYTPMDSSLKGAANGVASLDGLGQVPTSQLPLADSYSPTGTKPVTGTVVAAALATLPEPMVFKGTVGTGGTVTSLPAAANSNKGHTYKAISGNIVSGSKIGDTFISTGSAWVTIPSGDEPSGTVTQVGINASSGSHLSASGTVTSSGNLTVGVESGYQIPSSSDVSQITTNKTNILYALGKTGRNQFNIDMTTLKYWNTAGTWNGNVYTQGGLTFTFNNDGTIDVSGTATERVNIVLDVYYPLNTESGYRFHDLDGLVLSGCPTGGAWNKYSLSLQMTDSPWASAAQDTGSGAIIDKSVLPSNVTTVAFYLSIYASYPTSSLTFKPMFCTQEDWSITHDYTSYQGAPNYDLTRLESEDRASLAEVVDGGAKNLLDFANLTLQASSNVTVNKTDTQVTVTTNNNTWGNVAYKMTLAAGTYYYSCKISNLTVASGTKACIVLDSGSDGHGTRIATFNVSTGTVSFPFVWTGGTLYIFYYPGYANTANSNSFTAAENMICTKAAFGVSPKFVPYRPNYDLVCEYLPKTTKGEYSVGTAYALISGLPIVFSKSGTYRVSAYHSYSHAIPQGLIISRSDSDYTASLNILAKAETTSDVAVLSASVTVQTTSGTTYYIWAKAKTANTNQMGVTIEYLG